MKTIFLNIILFVLMFDAKYLENKHITRYNWITWLSLRWW